MKEVIYDKIKINEENNNKSKSFDNNISKRKRLGMLRFRKMKCIILLKV